IYTSTPASGANDAINNKKAAFTSSSHDQVQMTSVPMLEPAHIVGLPKGQAFALLEGGNLWKIRMPLPAVDPDEVMPKSLQELAAGMRKGQAANSEWWEAPGYSALQDGLPQDLVDDFRHLGAGEDAA
ncbi:conjugative coupling factor TraD, PFGI-1 class, partial [Pseudomonas aeruginosa]|nr:conjugative coupling factor TraD, PFGI-1 class [Pseudomonas aeruginosa]MCG7056975.1 conjugative coupling factor TraD, PFGI-1 class [Pseudomonas aeruginosa]MCG7074789.1 conjugative coupling factor TraD, PFGI-1 class [Pseudomonas aeruginosa]MCO3052393.1 conjugative coupling factor TraD, PFGI-1 class [Pseudomonas aeruginosa]MCO3638224.1 conjugative coupling factor TraD, PFGI-1 class [Pseudomonas aeruginosa]